MAVSRRSTAKLNRPKGLARSLKFLDGAVLIDEVDLVLHPLSSELNFPTGEKDVIDLAVLRWQLPLHLLAIVFLAESHHGTSKGHGYRATDLGATALVEELKQIIKTALRLRKMGNKPHLMLLDATTYTEILPEADRSMLKVFAAWLVQWLKDNHVHQCLLGGLDLAPDDILCYLTAPKLPKKDEESPRLHAFLDRLHVGNEEFQKQQKQLLVLARN